MSESNVDAIASILALPQVFIYENIIFRLELSLGVDEVLLAYVVDSVTPSSKYYLGDPQQKTWQIPILKNQPAIYCTNDTLEPISISGLLP